MSPESATRRFHLLASLSGSAYDHAKLAEAEHLRSAALLLAERRDLIPDSDAIPFLRAMIKDARTTGMSALAAQAFHTLIARVESLDEPDIDWLAQMNFSLAMTLTTGGLPGAETPMARAIEILKAKPDALGDDLVARLANAYSDLLSSEGRDAEAEEVLVWSLNRGSVKSDADVEVVPVAPAEADVQ